MVVYFYLGGKMVKCIPMFPGVDSNWTYATLTERPIATYVRWHFPGREIHSIGGLTGNVNPLKHVHVTLRERDELEDLWAALTARMNADVVAQIWDEYETIEYYTRARGEYNVCLLNRRTKRAVVFPRGPGTTRFFLVDCETEREYWHYTAEHPDYDTRDIHYPSPFIKGFFYDDRTWENSLKYAAFKQVPNQGVLRVPSKYRHVVDCLL